MATKNKKTKKSKKSEEKGSILIILLVMVLAAVIVFGGLVIHDQLREKEKTENETSDINTAPLHNNNDNSGTDVDNNENGDAIYDEKDAYDASQNNTEIERSDNGLKVAKTVLNINQNDQMIIFSARVTNFLETGGKCNYILTKGTEMVTYTKDVLPDPKTTVCESLVLEKSSLSAGAWNVKVEYKSNDAEGASETQSFTM